jgi:Phosphate/sulphate permeases
MLDTSGVVFLQLGAMAALALYVAANLGANDVANSMGTSVGSKALTLQQAIIVAGILEFSGAVLFGQGVSETLATGVVNAQVFAAQPQVFLIGMVSVLIACGIGCKSLPVEVCRFLHPMQWWARSRVLAVLQPELMQLIGEPSAPSP